MGYSERVCQICAISFNIGRIRKADEPPAAGWAGYGEDFVSLEDSSEPCSTNGCRDVVRRFFESETTSDQSRPGLDALVQEGFDDEDVSKEHIAGPECCCSLGYAGGRIPVEEIKDILAIQCLCQKQPDWKPEAHDEGFEVAATHCFVSGISTTDVDEFDAEGFKPVKHAISEVTINNITEDSFDPEDKDALPMHPKCFDMYKRMSLHRWDKVDIDGLWLLREDQGDYTNRFTDFPLSSDVETVSDQWYYHEPGTEYLAANPIEVSGLESLVRSCVGREPRRSSMVFVASTQASPERDPFAALQPELRDMLVGWLPRADVASLRRASPSFTQLPQLYFRNLIRREMPWVWEVQDLDPVCVDWHALWCKLSRADGGPGVDEKERHWRRSVPTKHYESLRRQLEAEGLTLQNDPRQFHDQHNARIADYTAAADAEIKAAYAAGMWPGDGRKKTELLGLRNRRRIYRDIEEIMTRIERLNVRPVQSLDADV